MTALDVLVAYDVATDTSEGRRRLRRVARACCAHGVRVQKSVFECRLSRAELVVLEARLTDLIKPDQDSVRIYRFREGTRPAVVTLGLAPRLLPGEPLII
jgi:CRISPR-associated protein Cas2